MEKLTSTEDALKFNFNRPNYQAKLRRGACQHDIVVKVPEMPEMSQGWQVTDQRLELVWSTLPAVPSTCLELVACGCKTKCKSATCKCSKSQQVCIPACGCNAENCWNPMPTSCC